MLKPLTLVLGSVAVAAAMAVAAMAAPPSSLPWHKRSKLYIAAGGHAGTAAAQRGQQGIPQGIPQGGVPQFGDALVGLSSAELADFTEGRSEFEAVETPEGGLGPIFNDASCAACHTAGGIGGASERTVTRFGRVVNGQFSSLDHLGGSLLQAKAIDPAVQETVPVEANVVIQRVTTPLFGAGLIEAISDQDIELNARRTKPDGVRGRALTVTDVATGLPRIGRFGWKAQQASLLAFAGDAYLNEMGVTSRLFPTENAPNGRTDLLARFARGGEVEDSIDPATGKSDIDHAADFMRLLAPPPRVRASASALAGERWFAQTNCTACHLPVMFSGASPIRALAHQPVPLYSDLLLHDMGRLGDGIEQGGAKAREMRTAPLWGLRARSHLLHDGRAKTVWQAIEAHDGEAAPARRRFEALSPAAQQQLLDFLQTI